MMHATILFIEGGHGSTAVGPLEVFDATGVLWNLWNGQPAEPRFRVRSVSVTGKPVQVAGQVGLTPQGAVSSIRKTDLIFVPSGGVDIDGILRNNRRVISWLQRQRKKGAYIAGVCSGVSLLAECGLLDGRVATTHWALVEDFRRRWPGVDWQPDKFVTESGGMFCGGGVYSSLDLSLYLVEKFCGHEVAIQTAKSLLIDMPRTSQAGFSVLPLGAQHSDETVRQAETWIHNNCRENFRLEDLAQKVGMSPRNFIRRFKAATGEAPLAYLQKLRIVAAKRLLESADSTVQQVSYDVGYQDVAFFRNLFKRHTGYSPNAYRQSFGTTPPVSAVS